MQSIDGFLYVLENYNDIIGLDYSDKTYSGSIISDKSKIFKNMYDKKKRNKHICKRTVNVFAKCIFGGNKPRQAFRYKFGYSGYESICYGTKARRKNKRKRLSGGEKRGQGIY